MSITVYKYDPNDKRISIKTDDTVIGELREVEVDNVYFVIKTLQEMYQQMFNKKVNCNER